MEHSPVKRVHYLELPLRVQLCELLQQAVAALLENGLVALERLLDQILGTVMLHLQLTEGIRQVTRCILTEAHLALALHHEALQLLALPVHRLRQALVVVLWGLVVLHQAVVTYRHLQPNTA